MSLHTFRPNFGVICPGSRGRNVCKVEVGAGWAGLELAALAEELAELGDRLVLVGAEV